MKHVDRNRLRRICDAIKLGSAASVREFLAEGYSPDTDENGTTLLMFAARLQQLEPARVLVEAGANVNAVNRENKTALNYALSDFRMPYEPEQNAGTVGGFVRLLVDAGASLSPDAARYDITYLPLYQAAKRGDADLVRYLIDKGAGVGVRDQHGGTALLAAINEGHPHVVKLLIDAGAQIHNPEPQPGRSPLHQAVSQGGSAISMARYRGEPEAKIAPMIADRIAVLDLLLAAGADLAWPDDRGWTALTGAINEGCPEVLVRVLDGGANLEQVDDKGRRPLHFLAELRRLEEPDLVPIARTLVRRGADRTAKTPDGKTAADIAAARGYHDLAATLR